MNATPSARPGSRTYFYRLDDMERAAFVPSMTTAEGSLVKGDKFYIGLVHKAKGSGSQPHRHPFEQFNYVVKGVLKAWVDGEERLVHPGGLIHIPAHTLHTTLAGPDGECVYLMVKEATPMGVAGVVEDPNVKGPRYERGFEPKPGA